MSYCRFSSDNFMCDVYVYEDVYGGFTTHVAGNRYAFPPLPSFPFRWSKGLGAIYNPNTRNVTYPTPAKRRLAAVYFWFFAMWEKARGFTLDHIPRRRIGLPNAGKRFNDATPGACANRLRELRSLGFNVPQYAIDGLVREQHKLEAPTP